MRIAPPSLPPHHSGPATRDFQSSISVEALFHRCDLDVQGLLHQQLVSSAMVQYGGLLPVDREASRCSFTLRLMLTKVKDTLPPGKQSNVVYRVPCSCGQVYIGETKLSLETRLKEHRDTCERGMVEKSAVAEHAWKHHHPIHWEETTILDHGRGQELLVKEALHIQMTPVEERFNRDGGLEVPGCWTAVMRTQEGRSNPHRPLTSNDVYP